jgi:hypothetical protein
MRTKAHRRYVSLMTVAAFWLLPAGRATATEPGVADCLAASDASLKSSHEHKLRAERAQLLACAAPTCPALVRKECGSRMDEVSAQIPTVVFEVRDATGRELSAVTITMDDGPLADHLDGTALMLDPGVHSFSFVADGQPSFSEDIVLHEGEKDRHIRVTLGSLLPSAPLPTGQTVTPVATPPERGHGQRVLGVVAGSVGLAGLIVGSALGGAALSSWNSARGACPSHTGCSASALGKGSDAFTFSSASTASFVAGGVLVAAGLALYFSAPRTARPVVGLRLAPGGVSLAAWF